MQIFNEKQAYKEARYVDNLRIMRIAFIIECRKGKKFLGTVNFIWT
jgi:hypothetical protein